MEDTIATINTKEGKCRETFTLTKTELRHRWENGPESGESSISLSKLKPRIEHSTGRPGGTRQQFIGGVVLVVLAVVIYFSALQPLAPLLSPAIAALGMLPLYRAFKNRRIEHYSTFQSKDDSAFQFLIASRCNSQELEQFEAAFEDQCAMAQFSSE